MNFDFFKGKIQVWRVDIYTKNVRNIFSSLKILLSLNQDFQEELKFLSKTHKNKLFTVNQIN